MRKVIASEFVSLDGVMEDPSWTFQFPSEEQPKFKFDELSTSDALLLGRVTYEGFAAAWPHMTEQAGEYADMMNGYPKFVVSTTLEEPLEWNNSTLIKGNVAEEVSRLKQQLGKDILIFGSGDLVNTLMRHDLIDEYRLMLFPVVVGSGKRLFRNGCDTKALRLVETKTFGSGVVLSYQPAGSEAEGQMETGGERVRSLRRDGFLSYDVGDQRPGAMSGG
jgi:dihydrofolate reductase